MCGCVNRENARACVCECMSGCECVNRENSDRTREHLHVYSLSVTLISAWQMVDTCSGARRGH